MTEPSIRFGDVTVRYPGRRQPALEDIGLEVRGGERVGVTGRTGAGKTTLALAAAGFIPRVVRASLTGTVTIDGVAATSPDPSALIGAVGIVFATPANQLSASKQTVREELAFGLENLGVEPARMDARIDAVLSRLGITHLADREPFALSGGEQQRVAIASIIAMGSRVLVLDEPTAQLDPAGTADVASLLDELSAEGGTILCVEHDPAVLSRMQRVLVLDGGRAIGSDVPGAALGKSIAGSVGLPSPTLVRLAEAGDVDPTSAFDIGAVGAGLRSAGAALAASAVAPGGPTAPTWTPIRDRAAVDIDIDGLTHRYPSGIAAVRNVSLHLGRGEAIAILGQNGSGKTTLVKHLDGLLRPDAGEVRIDGRVTTDVRVDELAATVGFVFQNPDDQLFERSVRREVTFGPRNLGLETTLVDALVERALSATGLAGEQDTNPYDLDLSRRKLVALASVLAMDPAVLVLDEPTTGQDPEGIERIGAVVRAWRDAGRTVVGITHDMEFAASHFDRVILMRRGEVIADGPPAEVLAVGNADLLASTGLTPPPTASVAAALGLTIESPFDADALLRALASRG